MTAVVVIGSRRGLRIEMRRSIVSQRPTLKKGSGNLNTKKFGATRMLVAPISPRQINDVTLVIDVVLVTIIVCQIIFSL